MRHRFRAYHFYGRQYFAVYLFFFLICPAVGLFTRLNYFEDRIGSAIAPVVWIVWLFWCSDPHRRLQLWCPWCRHNRPPHDEQTPVPDPDPSVKEPV